jgi:hypothetical protein
MLTRKFSGIVLMSTLVLLAFAFQWGGQQKLEPPKITNVKFGSIKIDGVTFEKDVVIKNGEVRERKKGPSKAERAKYGHTPLTPQEKIPWDCKKLVIGIGMSSRLPVTKEFKKEAKSRGVELILLQTREAIKYFMENYDSEMNAIFHITC